MQDLTQFIYAVTLRLLIKISRFDAVKSRPFDYVYVEIEFELLLAVIVRALARRQKGQKGQFRILQEMIARVKWPASAVHQA